MENKPGTLYRGLKIDYNSLQSFQFSDVDLIVNYPPIIDKYGRKTVKDGNEYGVYMSDNLSMVEEAYGNLHNDGVIIHANLVIDYNRIMIPSIGIIYKINTDGLDIREPFISDTLRGHYNNGFQGKEWIADVVPSSNYSLYRIRIGSDMLHPAQDVDLSMIKDIPKYLKYELEKRKYRLESFANAMERISTIKRGNIHSSEMEVLRLIYGENGVKYIDEEKLDTTSASEMLRYLIAKNFKQKDPDIDFQTLKYINELRKKATDVNSIIENIRNDIAKNIESKASFEQRKKQEGVPYTTGYFDKKIDMLEQLLLMTLVRKRSDEQHVQETTQSFSFNVNPVRETKVYEVEESRETRWRKIMMEKYGVESEAELDRLLEQIDSAKPEIDNVEQSSRRWHF